MAAERRVAACLILLIAALPLVLELMPDRVDAARPPLLALFAAIVVVLVPSHRFLQVGGALLGSAVVVAAGYWFAPTESLGLVVFAPLCLVVLTDRALMAGLGTVVASGAAIATLGIDDALALDALAGGYLADRLAQAAVVCWLGWHTVSTARSVRMWQDARRQRDTASALHAGVARDVGWLTAVARGCADASLSGPVRGHGLRSDALGLAVRLDHRRVLLGWLEGPPLATLTVGWALQAVARAGPTTPRALLSRARGQFDEIIAPAAVRWLAIWDRGDGTMEYAPGRGPQSMRRCVLTARGPLPRGRAEEVDSEAALRSMVGDDTDPLARGLDRTALAAAWLCWVPALAPIVLGGPAIAALGSVAAALVAHELLRRVRRGAQDACDESKHSLTARSEHYDELRNRTARLHGGLLPFRLDVGDAQATAHRLVGDVVDGTFADMLVDPQGNGRIVAGEVAGRGVAARFLGTAAQVVARSLLESGTQPSALPEEVGRRLEGLGDALGFPARVRLGVVTVTPDGRCRGEGSLHRLVRVRGTSHWSGPHTMLTAAELAAVMPEAELDDDTRVYLTPSPTLPGSAEDAPALPSAEAADRVVRQVRSGAWHPRTASLASLFSLVFDGTTAPSHGTIIELRRASAEEDGDDGRSRSSQEHEAAPTLAAS